MVSKQTEPSTLITKISIAKITEPRGNLIAKDQINFTANLKLQAGHKLSKRTQMQASNDTSADGSFTSSSRHSGEKEDDVAEILSSDPLLDYMPSRHRTEQNLISYVTNKPLIIR